MYNFKLADLNFLPHCSAHVDFSLEKGKAIVLTGENGVGKSTLMRRFYGEYESLSVLIDQTPLDYFYDRKLGKIKSIFLSTREGLIDEEQFQKMWELFGLKSKEDRFQSSLSGGEGQLLKLILGLSVKADIFLLDEPSHYLDSSMKEKLASLIEELIKNGKSFLIIEHEISWIKGSYSGINLHLDSNTLKVEKKWNT